MTGVYHANDMCTHVIDTGTHVNDMGTHVNALGTHVIGMGIQGSESMSMTWIPMSMTSPRLVYNTDQL